MSHTDVTQIKKDLDIAGVHASIKALKYRPNVIGRVGGVGRRGAIKDEIFNQYPIMRNLMELFSIGFF